MADAPGAESLRRHNAAAVIRALRHGGPGSRAQLAIRTGLAKATVGTIVAGLEEHGVVRSLVQVRSGERGRPGQAVTVVDSRPVGVGFEVNVEYVAAVVLDLAGKVRRQTTREVGTGEDVRGTLAALASDLAGDLDADGLRPLGATVALPGLVGGDDRTAVWVPNLDVGGRGLVEAVDRAFGWSGRTRAGNDADCSALAELHRGAGRGADHLLYLTGTVGIGAGLVEGGRLLRGARGFAGEVGHLPIGAADASCGCGRTGCWEASVGLHALLDAVGVPESGTPVETASAVALAARDSVEVVAAVASVGRWLGRGLAVVTGVLDPGIIVLGGYFAPLGGLILEPARAELASILASSELGCPDLRLGELGTGSAATGAAERALEAAYAGTVDLFA